MAVPPAVLASITTQKARYGRYIDTKQWEQLARVMLADCTLQFLDTDGSPLKVGKTAMAFTSRQAVVDFFHGWFARAETLHNFGPGEVEYSTAAKDEVQAIFAMEDQLIFKGGLEIRGGGYYYETWVLKDGEWYLKSLRLERTYNKITPSVSDVAIDFSIWSIPANGFLIKAQEAGKTLMLGLRKRER